VMFDVLRGHMESQEYPREVTVMVATEYGVQAFASQLGNPGTRVREPAVD